MDLKSGSLTEIAGGGFPGRRAAKLFLPLGAFVELP